MVENPTLSSWDVCYLDPRHQRPSTATACSCTPCDRRTLPAASYTVTNRHGQRQLAHNQHRRARPRLPRQLRPQLSHPLRCTRVDRRCPVARRADPTASTRRRQPRCAPGCAREPAIWRRRSGQGCPLSYRYRDSPVHSSGRHVTNTKPNIQLTGWNRGTGRAYEVYIQGNGTDERSEFHTQHHPPSNWFLSDPRPRRRRGRRSSHERAAELA